MEDSNTITVDTPGGHSVVLKKEMTGRDFRELQGLWYKDVTVDEVDSKDPDKTKISGMKAAILQEVEHRSFEIMLVSIDGATENLVEALYDLPVGDYNVIAEKVNELTNGFGQKKTG